MSRPPVVAFPEDRLPPQNIEAEQGVIGAILIEHEVYDDIATIVSPDDFWRDAHQVIMRAVKRVRDSGKPVDITILAEELARTGEYDRVGGWDGLAELANRVPHAANAKYHAEIVRQKSVKRRVISAAREILEDGYSPAITSDALVEGAERHIFAIGEAAAKGVVSTLTEAAGLALDRLERRAKGGECQGVPTGLEMLDAMTDGMQPGQLIVIAGRPSMGKTALSQNIAEHVALRRKSAVLFFSLEMGKIELGERALAGQSGVNGHDMRTGFMNNATLARIGVAFDTIREAGNFWIDDAPGRTASQVGAIARRHKAKHGLALIVVDYLQLLAADQGSGKSEQEQVAETSKRLKNIARELQVPLIAMAQLNRKSESREDRVPILSDLRASGQIEQDADMVWMIHRPDYYDKNDNPGLAKLFVYKNRNGSTGTINLMFDRPTTKFRTLEDAATPIDAQPF